MRLKRLGNWLAALLLLAAVPLAAHAKTGDLLDRTHLVQTFGEPCTEPGLEGRYKTNFISGVQSGYGSGSSRSLSGNHEDQIYVDRNYAGQLNPDPSTNYRPPPLGLDPFTSALGVCGITASRAPDAILKGPAGFGGLYHYISGLLTTQGRFAQLYGVFQIRLLVPAVRATWPAFWLLPTDGSWPPELDGVEILGHAPGVIYLTLHPGQAAHVVQVDDASKTPLLITVRWRSDLAP